MNAGIGVAEAAGPFVGVGVGTLTSIRCEAGVGAETGEGPEHAPDATPIIIMPTRPAVDIHII